MTVSGWPYEATSPSSATRRMRHGWSAASSGVTWQTEINESRHWDLIIRRKITGKQDPTRKDVRQAVREHRRQQGKEDR